MLVIKILKLECKVVGLECKVMGLERKLGKIKKENNELLSYQKGLKNKSEMQEEILKRKEKEIWELKKELEISEYNFKKKTMWANELQERLDAKDV